jgi:hypothetical protein
MTPKEAIKCLNYAEAHFTGTEYIEAFPIAVSAIEKQIPKKPVNIRRFSSGPTANCPMCSGRLVGTKFCHRCGQALDWSDSE